MSEIASRLLDVVLFKDSYFISESAFFNGYVHGSWFETLIKGIFYYFKCSKLVSSID